MSASEHVVWRGCARSIGRIGALAVALGVGAAIAVSPGIVSADTVDGEGPTPSASGTDPALTATDDVQPDGDSSGAEESTPTDPATDETLTDRDDETVATEDLPPTPPEATDTPAVEDGVVDSPTDPVSELPGAGTTDEESGAPLPAGGSSDGYESPSEPDGEPRPDRAPDPPAVEPTTESGSPTLLAPVDLEGPGTDSAQEQVEQPPTAQAEMADTTGEPTLPVPGSGVTGLGDPAEVLMDLVNNLLDSPTAPVQTSFMWTVLAMVRRELDAPAVASRLNDIVPASVDGEFAWNLTNDQVPRTAFGTDPEGVAVGPDGRRIYVASYDRGNVTVIDAQTMVVIGQIRIPGSATAVAVNPAGTRLYVANWDAGTVEIFDTTRDDFFNTQNQGRIASLDVGPRPEGLVVSRDGRFLYVTNDVRDARNQSVQGTVRVFDLQGTTPVQVSSISVGVFPVGVAISPDGKRLYVVNEGSNTLTTIDAESFRVLATTPSGPWPQGVAISTAGNFLFVTDRTTGTVRVLDVDTLEEVAPPIHLTDAEGIAILPGGHRIYVTSNSVGLRVIESNWAPTFVDDLQNTDPYTGTVTGQLVYTDENGDPLTFSTPAATAKGTVTMDTRTGAYSYSPTAVARHAAATDPNARTDTVTVTISDEYGATVTHILTVSITPANVAPEFVRHDQNTDTETALVSGHLVYTDADGDTLLYSGPASTAKGTVTLDTRTGAYIYTPTAVARHAAAADPLAGTDTFVVTITDGHGATLTHTITVTITPANTAPEYVRHDQNTDTETALVSGHLVYTDADGDTLTFNTPAATAKGTVTLDTRTGAYIYTPTAVARHAAAADPLAGTDTFVVTITDSHGATLTHTITVTITPANTAPEYVRHDQNTDTDTAKVSGRLVYTDADGDSLLYSGPASTAKGTVTLDTRTGAYIYTPTAVARHAAAADPLAGTDTFVVTITDGHGATLTHTITVTITPANTAPEFVRHDQNTDTETAVVSGHLVYTDADGDTLTFNTPAATAKGTVTLDTRTGVYRYTPTAVARHAAATDPLAGTDTFVVTITDGHGAAVTHTITVTITPANTAPEFVRHDQNTDTETAVVSGHLVYTDADGDTLTFNTPAATAKGTVTLDTRTGVYRYTPTAVARHAAATDPLAGTDTFVVTITDGHGAAVTHTITITITPANTAPEFVRHDQNTDTETAVVSGHLVYTDADGDTLLYSGPASTAKGTVTLDTRTGAYIYTPTAVARHAAAADPLAGTDTFVVTITDGHGATLTHTITVTITPANTAPEYVRHDQNTDDDTAKVSGRLVYTDADEDPLTFNAPPTTAKGILTLDTRTGAYIYTPTAVARHAAAADPLAGTDTFVVTITDGHGATLTHTITATISPANTAPEYIGHGYDTDPDSAMIAGRLLFTDIDNDTLTYSGPASTAKGTLMIDARTGNYLYTPSATARLAATAFPAAAIDTFVVTITDGHGATLTHTITVTITGFAAPIADPMPAAASDDDTVSVVVAAPVEEVIAMPQVDATALRDRESGSDQTRSSSPPAVRAARSIPDRADPPDALSSMSFESFPQHTPPEVPPAEIGHTSRVETGTQATTVSVVLLAIGGWFFFRRFTSAP